jgi:hypothetical protein
LNFAIWPLPFEMPFRLLGIPVGRSVPLGADIQTDVCATRDQPTLSKVLRGRMESVTIDRLTAWLTALGRTVEIHVRPYDAKAKTGHLIAAP